MNPDRITLPDIDIDFCFERRGEVLEYVTRKYGEEHVAQIVTFGTMGARAVIRDVGRVFGIPLTEVDRVAKMVPFEADITISQALGREPDLRTIYEKDERIRQILDVAKGLEGMARHASVHAAGVVISEKPLIEHTPLQRISETQIVTQYSMGDLEKIGLLKMDFLGLRNLTMIAHTLEIIEHTHGVKINLDDIPLDDPKTYELFSSAETIGIFQLESRGMRSLIKELRPTAFGDIIALLALYRPGPLESGMVDDFIKRKHKLVPVKYEIPELEPILKETHGVILYQEQVMEIASKIAGFTLSQADVLRSAMGKKKTKEMTDLRERFIEGAVASNISQHKATILFNLCSKFAGYGFNKSHSTSYAVISYQTAYLKANYPSPFMAALLTSVMGDADKTSLYISECGKMGIPILPPDVNESYKNFTVTPLGIRFGLIAVKNVGLGAVDTILSTRKEGGKFKSLFDFCSRVDLKTVNKRVIESLIKSGAFDTISGKRAYLLSILEETLEKVGAETKEKVAGQVALFDVIGEIKRSEGEIIEREVEDFPPEVTLKMEKEMLGLYISDHPLKYVKDSLESQITHRIVELHEKKEGDKVIIGGLLTESRRIVTRRGELMMVGNLEDLTSKIGLVIFPRAYEKYSTHLRDDLIVIVKGRLNRDSKTNEINVIAEIVEPLSPLKRQRALNIEITDLKREELLETLKDIFILNKGESPVYLHMDSKKIAIGDQYKVNIEPSLISEIEELLGEGSVWVDFSAEGGSASGGKVAETG